MRFLSRCCLCAVAVLATTACTATGLDKSHTEQTSASVNHVSNQLSENSQWRLMDAVDSNGKRITAFFIENEPPVELHFMGNSFSVQNACNVTNGVWLQDGQKITLSSLMSTKMMCHPALNNLEQLVTQQLAGPAEISFTGKEQSQMVLQFADGNKLSFERF